MSLLCHGEAFGGIICSYWGADPISELGETPWKNKKIGIYLLFHGAFNKVEQE